MTSSEVKGVVDFEARRYIPFKLEDLVYSYHATTVVEKKIRRIRILFIAIRKEILERYCSVLEQAGLRATFIEPASISLLRALTFKKQIQRQQRIAIIQTNQREGTITIVDQGIPQFVRDFQLVTSLPAAPDPDGASINTRLLNEIRISLDYYRRLHSMGEIDKLLFIFANDMHDLAEALGKSLGVATVSLATRSLLNLDEEVNPGVLNAFGVGLRHAVSLPVTINLSRIQVKSQEAEKIFEQTPINYLASIKVGAACGLAVLFVFLFLNFKLPHLLFYKCFLE